MRYVPDIALIMSTKAFMSNEKRVVLGAFPVVILARVIATTKRIAMIAMMMAKNNMKALVEFESISCITVCVSPGDGGWYGGYGSSPPGSG